MNLLTKLSCISAGAAFISLGIVSTAQAVSVTLESAPLDAPNFIGGLSVIPSQFLGWRFQVTDTLQVTDIGGHLGSTSPNNEIFGAIVSLSEPNAFPQSNPFQPGEVLAATTLNPSFPTNDVTVPLSVTLNPGNYALVFGSGLFGASGDAYMPYNDTANEAASLFDYVDGFGWRNIIYRATLRFVVKGEISCR